MPSEIWLESNITTEQGSYDLASAMNGKLTYLHTSVRQAKSLAVYQQSEFSHQLGDFLAAYI
jgi:hypothetical protein